MTLSPSERALLSSLPEWKRRLASYRTIEDEVEQNDEDWISEDMLYDYWQDFCPSDVGSLLGLVERLAEDVKDG